MQHGGVSSLTTAILYEKANAPPRTMYTTAKHTTSFTVCRLTGQKTSRAGQQGSHQMNAETNLLYNCTWPTPLEESSGEHRSRESDHNADLDRHVPFRVHGIDLFHFHLPEQPQRESNVLEPEKITVVGCSALRQVHTIRKTAHLHHCDSCRRHVARSRHGEAMAH